MHDAVAVSLFCLVVADSFAWETSFCCFQNHVKYVLTKSSSCFSGNSLLAPLRLVSTAFHFFHCVPVKKCNSVLTGQWW